MTEHCGHFWVRDIAVHTAERYFMGYSVGNFLHFLEREKHGDGTGGKQKAKEQNKTIPSWMAIMVSARKGTEPRYIQGP